MSTAWFVSPRPRSDAAVRLYCLPYAGAGASVFHRWSDGVGPDIEISALRLPGRETRIGEHPRFRATDVARQMPHLADDRPYAIYGHSMGARIGFEVIRLLRSAGSPLPVRFYVGGASAPDFPPSGLFHGLSRISDEQLLARIAQGGGAPPELLADKEILGLVLPILRSDFTWMDEYAYRPDEPLPMPIVAFAGTRDDTVPSAAVDAWAAHTAAGFTRCDVEGGHFFLNENLPAVLGPLTADLLAAIQTPR